MRCLSVCLNIRSLWFLLAALLLASCASLPENDQQVPSYALPEAETARTTVAQGIQKRREGDNQGTSAAGMLLLKDGVDAFVARVALARLAEKSLDVQYYLYHDDLSGGLLMTELWKAAERGVRVRILLDDMDMAGKDHNLAILDAHENIEIRLFNPFIRGKSRTGQLLTRFGSVTRRAHNKSMTADNQLAIIGGRNIGDQYFGADLNMAFGDLDVAITNPGASEVSQQFDLYWNSELAYPVATLSKTEPTQEELNGVVNRIQDFYEENKDSEYIVRIENSGIIQRAQRGETHYHWGNVLVLYDHPEKISADREQTEFHLTPKLIPYLEATDSELLVISPYFVPGKEGVELFTSLEQRGVDVRILTNSLMSNDVPIVHAGYSKYRKELLEVGVQLYELDVTMLGSDYVREKTSQTREGIGGSKASLHAKYFVMDRESAFIGSLNLDPRSVVENTEIGAVIDSPQLAQELASGFDEHIRGIAFELKLEDGKLVWHRYSLDGEHKVVGTYHKEPHSSWWDRFMLGFMKLLPVESQL